MGAALIHNMCVYVPPGLNAEQRMHILRNVLWVLDFEVNRANGLHHVIVSGDFNLEGMKDMRLIAAARNLKEIASATRNSNQLDAVFVSAGVEITQQITTKSGLSDHCHILTKLKFPITHAWVNYAIEVPITTTTKRNRLRNATNRQLLNNYSLYDGPFALKAQLGQLTQQQSVHFGTRPPTAFHPRLEHDNCSAARIAGLI